MDNTKPLTVLELLQKLEHIVDRRILATKTLTKKLSDIDNHPEPTKIGA